VIVRPVDVRPKGVREGVMKAEKSLGMLEIDDLLALIG